MRILGIDPGPEYGAVIVHECARGNRTVEWVEGKCVLDLGRVIDRADSVGAPFDALVIESIAPAGLPLGHDLLKAIRLEERMVFAAEMRHLEVHRIKRREVKLHLLGKAAGTDAQVNAALRAAWCARLDCDEKQLRGTKKSPGPLYGVTSHAWPALACVETFLDRQGVTAP